MDDARAWDVVTTSDSMVFPDVMKAWVLGDPDQVSLVEEPLPVPGRAEALVRIVAVAICATDLDARGRFDFAKSIAYCQHLLSEGGCDGVAPTDTTGEGTSVAMFWDGLALGGAGIMSGSTNVFGAKAQAALNV